MTRTLFTTALLLFFSHHNGHAQYRVTTIAGTGVAGFSGEGAPASTAQINAPAGVCADKAGNVFIADNFNSRIRKIDAVSGLITTIAGDGVSPGNTSDGGPATAAGLNRAYGVCLDDSGNIYVSTASAIRKITVATGIITTVAGDSAALGYAGDGGLATDAKLASPKGMAVDHAGNIYIADQNNNVIRKVTKATGIITTFAGTGVMGFSGENVPATDAQLKLTSGVALDNSGNVYIGDNSRIRKIDAATGIIKTIGGTGVNGYTGDGGNVMSAQLTSPTGISLDSAGNIYIVDGYSAVRKVDAVTNIITTIAGNSTPGYAGDGLFGSLAQFQYPYGVFASAGGNNVYVADRGNNRIRLLHTPTVGVDALETQNTATVYPNPSQGFFTVGVSYTQDYQLSVYNSLGQVVYHSMSTANTTNLDLTDLPDGVYFLYTKCAESISVTKLVISK